MLAGKDHGLHIDPLNTIRGLTKIAVLYWLEVQVTKANRATKNKSNLSIVLRLLLNAVLTVSDRFQARPLANA